MVTRMKRQRSHLIPKKYTTAYNYAAGEWRQSYVSNHDRKKDDRYKAKAPGWRPVYNKNGEIDHYYFERRNNRSDTAKQRAKAPGVTTAKKKTTAKKTVTRKGTLFKVNHAYSDQYEVIYKAKKISADRKTAVFEMLTLPKRIEIKVDSVKWDAPSACEYIKLKNGSVIWADGREEW